MGVPRQGRCGVRAYLPSSLPTPFKAAPTAFPITALPHTPLQLNISRLQSLYTLNCARRLSLFSFASTMPLPFKLPLDAYVLMIPITYASVAFMTLCARVPTVDPE